jgi:hypothetical protein
MDIKTNINPAYAIKIAKCLETPFFLNFETIGRQTDISTKLSIRNKAIENICFLKNTIHTPRTIKNFNLLDKSITTICGELSPPVEFSLTEKTFVIVVLDYTKKGGFFPPFSKFTLRYSKNYPTFP